jgi:hypothetical protein
VVPAEDLAQAEKLADDGIFYAPTPYYVTVTERMDRVILKLTEDKEHALPIVDSSGLGDDLQVVYCLPKCPLILMDES